MEEDGITKTPAEELRSQIDYCVQILDQDADALSHKDKLAEVGPVIWDLWKALQEGKVELRDSGS